MSHHRGPVSVQLRCYQLLFGKEPGDRTRAVVEWTILGMIMASIVAIVLESVPALHSEYSQTFHAFEAFSVAFFTVEYLVRLWSVPAGRRHTTAARARLGYVLSFHGLVDLMAILPFYLHAFLPGLDLRFMRAVRMLRILKISHYNTALEDLLAAIYEERQSFFSAIYLLAIGILISACLMYTVEHKAQPEHFASIPAAMWWSIVTLTTVGYGDVYPITALGKLLGAGTALLGVCTVALLTGIVANSFANQMTRKRAVFEAEVHKALAEDRHIDETEAEALERLRIEFNLTHQHAQAIIKRVQEEIRTRHSHQQFHPPA
jgi:voltage-gated potassium channel